MKQKKYSSFEEIDTQLKILKLKTAIDKEQLSFNYNKMKYYLYPKNIILEIGNTLKQKLIDVIYERYHWIF